MRINGFRCDVCCKEHLLTKDLLFQGVSPELLPKEWLILWHGGEHSLGQEAVLVCSIQCLHDWVEKKLPLPPAEVARIANEVQEEITHWEKW